MARPSGNLTPVAISARIRAIRGRRVLLDFDLAELYGVETKVLNQAVRRNPKRFPDDFLIELTAREWQALRSQIVTLEPGRGRHRKYLPQAFTEHGAIMAANMLNSARAVEMSVQIVRAFVRLRQVLASNADLARKLVELERAVNQLDARTQRQYAEVYRALKALMAPQAAPSRSIGFTADLK